MVRILIGGKLEEVARMVERLEKIEGLEIIGDEIVNYNFFDPSRGSRRLEINLDFRDVEPSKGRTQG